MHLVSPPQPERGGERRRPNVLDAVSHRPEAETAPSIFALSHFRPENRFPLSLKML
jgi:hypothetical protein